MPNQLKYLLFLLAFIEGGAVMCVELCSAKMLAPYFGTSIYVWAAVLGITLTALMSGYYLGGYLSEKSQKKEMAFWLMLIAGCLVAIAPLISGVVIPLTIKMSLLSGTVISLLSFLFIPLMLFGAVSPLLINQLTDEAKASGKSSGNVYAVSTLGGIITTFFVGFYTLPHWGIVFTLYGYGALVIAVSVLLFLASKRFNLPMAIIAILGLSSLAFQLGPSDKEVIYKSDGIMGELKVVNRTLFYAAENREKVYRELMVNNVSQTIMDIENPELSYWDYVGVLMYNLNSYAKGKSALLLGMGGGTVYKQLVKEGLQVDIVEIDPRIEMLAKKYFNIDPATKVIIDDARHYIKTTDKKYDVIIYDLYHSETPPIHLMTQEAFTEIRAHLNEQGILIVNFYGFINGSKGLAARSLFKTLLAQKFEVNLIATPGEEASRNLLFFCAKDKLSGSKGLIHTFYPAANIDFKDALILTDDKPILEHLYLEAALSWRRDYNKYNAEYFLKKK
jgi:predicted membrane-bound spermidine synthase